MNGDELDATNEASAAEETPVPLEYSNGAIAVVEAQMSEVLFTFLIVVFSGSKFFSSDPSSILA